MRKDGRRGALATIVNVRGSIPSFKTAKMLVRDDGSILGTIGGGCVEAEVWQAAREVMESERPRHSNSTLITIPSSIQAWFAAAHLRFSSSRSSLPRTFIFSAQVTLQKASTRLRNRWIQCHNCRRPRDLCQSRALPRGACGRSRKISKKPQGGWRPSESSFIVIVTRGHRDDMRVLRWAVQTSRSLCWDDRLAPKNYYHF